MLGKSAVVVVLRTRPRAIPLAKITMRKSTHGFPYRLHYNTCLMPIYILSKSYITVNTYSSKNIEYVHLLADYGFRY